MSPDTTPRAFLCGGLGLAGGAVAAGALPFSGPTAALGASTPRPGNGDAALARLLAGNRRFVNDKLQHPGRDTARLLKVADKQKPFAVILGCADSRVSPEILFDEGIGDLFAVRVAGNTASAAVVIGSLEYAVATFGSALLMVLGHSACGAVKAAIDVVTNGATLPGDIGDVVAPILPAVRNVQSRPPDQLLEAAIQENVRVQRQTLAQNAILAQAVNAGKLKIIGAEFDLAGGKVALVQ
jgi:carbonic anhydrase